MTLKMASVLALGLSLPSLYFAPQYLEPLIRQHWPLEFFSSASDYYLFMLIVMGLPAGLGGLLAGWLWRWKGILLIPLQVASVVVTAGIESYRWRSGIPAALDVPPRYIQVLQWGIGGTAAVIFALIVGAVAAAVSAGMRRRRHAPTFGCR